VEDRLVRLRRTIFDPSYDVSITVKDPPPGKDIVTASANNLYEGVTLKEVESFPERYPLNSKVIKRGGRIEELVYRAGDPSSGGPGGLYGHEMGDMADRLETVLPMVGPGQRAALEHLMRYFRTGEPEEFRQYNIAWVQDNPPVDAILGFIETYVDARSQKGFFEGQVSIVDQKTTHLMQWLAQNALYFEGRAPWKESYKRARFKPPVANAITVLMETGGAGPVGWSGINLPNEQAIKEKYGSKSVLLANNIESRSAAVGAGLAEIFASSPEERDTGAKHYREARTLLVAMHEVLGHASGRVNPALKGDPSDHLREFYSTLEEARADLVALWNFFDEKLMADRMMSDPKVAEVAYQSYLWDNWVSLNQISEGDSFEEDHQRAEHLVCSYVAERTKAIRGFERDARHYRVVTDFKEMRRGVGELLAELMRIKAEGDYQAAKALISRYGVRFDPSLRDEVRRAAGAAGYPDVVAFVMPRYTPVYDSRRNIKDVTVSYPGDFLAEQLSYAGKSLPASR
jgi:dipeptidyl-peptidase-3